MISQILFNKISKTQSHAVNLYVAILFILEIILEIP